MSKRFTDDDEALLAELGVEAVDDTRSGASARDERIIAGFEDIQRFVEQHGRLPQHGEGRDIFERLYAARLDRIRALPECSAVVKPMDHHGLLTATHDAWSPATIEHLNDDELLAELGGERELSNPLTELRFVQSAAAKRAAEDIAARQRCEDFGQFRARFADVKREIERGLRETRRFERKSEIEAGRFYIIGGQTAFVASMDKPFTNDGGMKDARLRVIFDNGTESNLLMRSLQRALQQDASGRRVTERSFGPLFAAGEDPSASTAGLIYVLRSRLDHPFVAAHRDVIHKIGVTGGDVERRVGDTLMDPTFLMGEIEVVATYRLFDLNRNKLETVLHRVFHAARLDIEVPDRFGQVVRPQEWFLVPLFVIDEAIERIRDGSISDHVYDPQSARLVPA